MPIERIQIIITEEGGRRVKANIDDIGKSAEGAAAGTEQLKTVLGQIGAAATGVGAASAQLNKLSAAMAQIASAHGGLGASIANTVGAVNQLAASYERLSAAERLAVAQASALRASTGYGGVTSAEAQVLAQEELAVATAASNAQLKQIASTQAGLGAVITGVTGNLRTQTAAWEGLSAAQQLSVAQASALRAAAGYGMVSTVEAEVLAQRDLAVAAAAANAQLQNTVSIHGGLAATISGVTASLNGETAAWGRMSAAQQLATAQASAMRAAAGYGVVGGAEAALLAQEQMGQARLRMMAALPGQYKAVGAAAGAAARQIEATGVATTKAARGFSALGNSLFSIKTLVGALLVRELVNLTNTYQSLQNRIRVVTKSDEELGDVSRQLYEISQRTRVGFEDTAETYARMAFNTRSLGLSQKELMTITEGLNMALIVGGARAQEGSNALIQLSQAFATGRLRADEFRAVTEQLPVVADALAAHFKITRGELLKLSIEGKITAEEMLKAFNEMIPDVMARFGKTLPTIEHSFVRIKNALMVAFGEMAKESGAATMFSDAVVKLVSNLELLKGVLKTVMAGILIFVGVKGVQLLMQLVIGIGGSVMAASLRVVDLVAKIRLMTTTLEGVFLLRAGLVATLAPLALIAETLAVIAAIGTIAVLIKLTIEEPKGMGKALLYWLLHLGTPGEAMIGAVKIYEIEKIKHQFANLATVIDNFPDMPKFDLSQFIGPDLGKALEDLDREYELLRMGNVERRVATELDKIRASLTPENRQLNSVEEAAVRSRILRNIGQEELNSILEQKKSLEDNLRILQLSGDTRERESQLSQILKNVDLGISAELRKQLSTLIQQTIELERKQKFAKAIEDLRQENVILKANRHERETMRDVMSLMNDLQAPMLPLQMAIYMAYLKQNQALRDKNKLLEEIVGPDDEVLLRTKLLGELLKEEEINLAQYGLGMRQTFQIEARSDRIVELVMHLDDLHNQYRTGNLLLQDYRDAMAEAFGVETRSMQIRQMQLQLEGLSWMLDIGAVSIREYRTEVLKLQVQLDELLNLDRTGFSRFGHGITNGLRRLVIDASDFGSTVSEWVVGSFDRASEAIVQFAQHGKDAFGDLANYIITELLRITSQQFFAELLGMILKTGAGSVGTGAGSPGTQAGEFYDSSDLVNRASAGVGMRANAGAPPTAEAQQRGQNTVSPNNIRIINVINPQDIIFAMRSSEGERAIVNVIERNPASLRRVLGVT